MTEYSAHPVHSKYSANKNGHIINNETDSSPKVKVRCLKRLFQIFTILEERNPKTNKRKFHTTHVDASQFVYECFNGVLSDGKAVFHIDGNRDNRSLDNLESMTLQEFRTRRADELVATGEYTRHPELLNYLATKEGKVYSVCLDKFLPCSLASNDYFVFTAYTGLLNNLKIRVNVHVFVYECFNGIDRSEKFHIDHTDNDHSHNHISNLQRLTPAEHLAKTKQDVPEFFARSVARRTKHVKRSCIESGEEEVFLSSKACIENTVAVKPSASSRAIQHCLAGDQKTHKGFTFEYYHPDLESEEWKDIPGVTGLQVSNMGRGKFLNGRTTSGNPNRAGYCVINIERHGRMLHELICLAFHPHPTVFGDPMYNVDHRNRITDDNRPENLRWATREQQAANTRRAVRVLATDAQGQSFQFDTIAATARHIGASASTVGACLNPRMTNIHSAKGWTFQRTENADADL